MTPCGWEQALSLAWALENIAGLTQEDAVRATSELFGFEVDEWQTWIADSSWFVGDVRCNAREQIELKWNERYARATEVWLDEDAWHAPLWALWLYDPKMVCAANLRYLIELQDRGGVRRLAEAVGRSTTTASKWGRWREQGIKVRVPPRPDMPKVLDFFGLGATVDLYAETLFLGRSEIQDDLKRIEGKHYLDNLSGEFLKQAVLRLREESGRQILEKMRLQDDK